MAPTRGVAFRVLLSLAALWGALAKGGPEEGEDTRYNEIAAWTKQYAAKRAAYYLMDARRMMDKALKHLVLQNKGQETADPYLKVWDAQSQLSAAVSWDNESADLWFEAGNVTFTLAGIMRDIGEGDFLNDALTYWANALRLEIASKAQGRPLAKRLRTWLDELRQSDPKVLKKRVPQKVWLAVRDDAWREVQRWDMSSGGQPPPRTIFQRKTARLAETITRSAGGTAAGECSVSQGGADCRTPSAVKSSGWLSDKIALGKEVVFPTLIYRTNLMEEMGKPFFDKLSKVAVDKYSKFRIRMQKKQKEFIETRINDAFFQSQETHEHAVTQDSEAVKQWPELYSSPEYAQFLKIARNASLAYLKHSGLDATQQEVDNSWLISWCAVYAVDPGVKARHGWHTHQESTVSGVLYTDPKNTPILFADPRGAPPIDDYEQYRAEDMLFEPKAPFDSVYHMFAKQGDLVLFPSWLVHKVPPPQGLGAASGGFRVAFPFNFHFGTAHKSQGSVWDGWERTVMVSS